MAKKKTLRQYAKAWAKAHDLPIMDYARELAEQCGVSVETARKWIYGVKTPMQASQDILACIVGPIRYGA